MPSLLSLSKIHKAMNLASLYLSSPINQLAPEPVEFAALTRLVSCKSIAQLKQIHASIIKTKPPQTQEQKQLLYAKLILHCSDDDAGYASSVLARLDSSDVFVYNETIRKFARSQGSCFMALVAFKVMLENGVVPDRYTLPFVLKACAEMREVGVGRVVHGFVVKCGMVVNLYVKNTLMRLYAVCGGVGDVQKVFDGSPERDLVSWTTLIQGCVKSGLAKEGIDAFFEMGEENLRADEKLMVVVLSGCARLGDLQLARRMYRYVCENRLNVDVFVGNALVDMYMKCGDLDFAWKVFNDMDEKNVVTWNAMIAGLAQLGEFKEALSVFRRMQKLGLRPDDITLVGVLNSCANSGALELGKWVNAFIDKNGILADGYIGNALVDMYAKCGSIDEALRVFASMKYKDVYSYTSLIVGLAAHGQAEKALQVFAEMPKKVIKPDEVTFVGVLTACSHAGLLQEGQKHFEDMSDVYNLSPLPEHYGCMVDILGRSGLIDEAEEFIQKMPIEPDAFVWGALLGACSIHGRVVQGKWVLEKLIEIEPGKDGAYILMSNIYSSASRWKDALKLRKSMKDQKLKKAPGCSSIELDGTVHEFRKGDKSHPKFQQIHAMLDNITFQLKNVEHAANSCELL
uniref:Pentatricopeptide repeat-containing protein n=1 Tax=Kalanchoe fedtschenkoi TaxID=63787 RepID=A0A7N0TDW4_KALFE